MSCLLAVSEGISRNVARDRSLGLDPFKSSACKATHHLGTECCIEIRNPALCGVACGIESSDVALSGDFTASFPVAITRLLQLPGSRYHFAPYPGVMQQVTQPAQRRRHPGRG